jgi:cyclopropane fatty-acyl-phospholipid synthase-like methyltransferase
MNEPAAGAGTGGPGPAVRYYKRDFWSQENLKFSQPWYRLEKTVRLIGKLAAGRECTLLDIGCGPAALMRLLPAGIRYHGIDIAIAEPAPNLIEADLLTAPIKFSDQRFDIVVAQGVFEYLGEFQSQKFAEIAELLRPDGKFLVTYTNFGHRKRYVYPAFSNIQPLADFRRDLARHFEVERFFPVSHNWKHGHPSRRLLKAVNMPVNVSLPVISPLLAVEYYFVCSPRGRRRT